jgi:hypothetical protein
LNSGKLTGKIGIKEIGFPFFAKVIQPLLPALPDLLFRNALQNLVPQSGSTGQAVYIGTEEILTPVHFMTYLNKPAKVNAGNLLQAIQGYILQINAVACLVLQQWILVRFAGLRNEGKAPVGVIGMTDNPEG